MDDDCGCGMGEGCQWDGNLVPKLTVYFNPFNHTIEENNEFLRRGYEVMPIRVPSTDTMMVPRKDR